MRTYYLHRLDGGGVDSRYGGHLGDGKLYLITTNQDHHQPGRPIRAKNRAEAWQLAREQGPDRLTGYEAIEHAETHGLLLSKFTDPTEGHRAGLTPDEAREVASEDPSLIYLFV